MDVTSTQKKSQENDHLKIVDVHDCLGKILRVRCGAKARTPIVASALGPGLQQTCRFGGLSGYHQVREICLSPNN